MRPRDFDLAIPFHADTWRSAPRHRRGVEARAAHGVSPISAGHRHHRQVVAEVLFHSAGISTHRRRSAQSPSARRVASVMTYPRSASTISPVPYKPGDSGLAKGMSKVAAPVTSPAGPPVARAHRQLVAATDHFIFGVVRQQVGAGPQPRGSLRHGQPGPLPFHAHRAQLRIVRFAIPQRSVARSPSPSRHCPQVGGVAHGCCSLVISAAAECRRRPAYSRGWLVHACTGRLSDALPVRKVMHHRFAPSSPGGGSPPGTHVQTTVMLAPPRCTLTLISLPTDSSSSASSGSKVNTAGH